MIVRIDRSGPTPIATGLSFPTGMTFGPDGALYVSNLGFAGAAAGQILKVTVPAAAASKAAHGDQGDDDQGDDDHGSHHHG